MTDHLSKDLKSTDVRLPDGTVARDGKVYGCHLDLLDGQKPDGCAAVEVSPDDCTFGSLGAGRVRRSRWTCSYWREIEDQ